MEDQAYIPYREIVDHLDIQASDVLIIASDITRLAFQAKRNEGRFDIDAFIDSFTEKLTMSGTLIFPAYNFNLRSGQAFDLKRTTPATGAMPIEAFRRMEFNRTWHPLHSFMTWGQKNNELKGLRNINSFGSDSPFAKFLEWNAKMLFIGTNVAEAFTYTHHVEEMEKVWYRHYRKRWFRYYEDGAFHGKKKFGMYEKRSGWTMNLDLLQKQLESTVLQTRVINKVECSMLNIKDADKVIRSDIRDNRARNIAHFEYKLYARDMAKELLQKFNLYKTTQDKINYGIGI